MKDWGSREGERAMRERGAGETGEKSQRVSGLLDTFLLVSWSDCLSPSCPFLCSPSYPKQPIPSCFLLSPCCQVTTPHSGMGDDEWPSYNILRFSLLRVVGEFFICSLPAATISLAFIASLFLRPDVMGRGNGGVRGEPVHTI